MGFTLVALALGLVLGLATGGRPANISRRPIRAMGALAVGVALQGLLELVDVSDGTGLAGVYLSYVLLLAFAITNLRLVGMPVVLLGLALNVLVIGLNGGMPVRGEAILAIDPSRAGRLERIDFGSKRHLEDDDDRLTLLGDIIPVVPLGEVLSFGDLIMSAGIANIVFRLLRTGGASPNDHDAFYLYGTGHDGSFRPFGPSGENFLSTTFKPSVNMPTEIQRTLTTESRVRRRERVGTTTSF